MTNRELTEVVENLAQRVARLEESAPFAANRNTAIVARLLRDLEQDDSGAPGAATVVYAGAGAIGQRTVAWQMGRSWDDVRAAAGDAVARTISALSNGTRLRIVAELLQGPVATGDLADRLEQPSSGQLFHHLKDLIAAGIVHQPERGTYAIRRQHVVPLLAVLSAAADLTNPSLEDDDP